MNRKLSHALASSLLLIVLIAAACGQDIQVTGRGPTLDSQQGGMTQGPGVVIRGGATGKELGFQFVGAEPAMSATVVKGKPYSLEASVQTEQTLADGNRIVHRQIVHVYRDSDGRTRRDETLAAIGPWAASGTPPTVVSIQDPVSGDTYSLDPGNKTATKFLAGLPGQVTREFHTAGGGIAMGATPGTPNPPVTVRAFNAGQGVVVFDGGMAAPAKLDESQQSLGTDTIAGVSAEGFRTITTIPADTMGNERPIEITRERWFSSELQIVLRSKQSDPRFGVTTYEVTKLDRANPSRSLFEIPRDYRIVKAPQPPPPPPK